MLYFTRIPLYIWHCDLDHNNFPTKRELTTHEVTSGLGYCLITYVPGSKRLDAFDRSPFQIPMQDTLESTMETIWSALEPEWRVALGGKMITKDGVSFAHPLSRYGGAE